MSEVEGESEDLEAVAAGFDGDDEDTSPEVVRHTPRAGVHGESTNPLTLVASRDAALRREIIELLWQDGWNAVEIRSPEELLETVRATSPQVALVDADFRFPTGFTAPEVLRTHRPESAIRVVALLNTADTDEIATAVVDGFDDFIMNPRNQVEVLARATSNLRASRSVTEVHRQRRDLASLLELSQTLASSLDLTLILHTVSRLIAGVIEVERCSIVLLDPERRDAVMVAASEDRQVRDLRIDINSYPELKRCVETAAPVLIADARTDPLLATVRDSVSATGIKGMALFPIVFEERVMGVLFLRTSEEGRQLSDHEVQFGQTVASACAVAVRNARLFDSFRDQTERMNYMRLVAERQMEALKKYEDFFEYAADGMAIVDTEAQILYVNREGRRLLGREQEEMRGKSFLTYIGEESGEVWPDVVDQVRHGRFRNSFDLYALHGDGTDRIFWLTAGGVGQDTGLIILSFRDVTETREMELELRTTKEFLENLIDNSVDAIVAADMGGNIMLFNKGAEKLFDISADDVVGSRHVNDLYPDGVANEIMGQLRDERWGGRGRLEAQRKVIRSVTGAQVPVSMTASIIYEDGEEVATVGVFTDLRDRLQMEQRLSEAEEELMNAERARVAAELAGMAAHELNQPLTSVLGYAEMLRHRVKQEVRNKKIADTIYEQAERMAEIVRKIGRITKYETKHYGARTNMIDLERASQPDANGRERSAEATDKNVMADGPEERRSTGRFRAYPEQAAGESSPAGDWSDPPVTQGEVPSGERRVDGAGLMAHLASQPFGSSKDDEVTDPRHAIVRPDTIDDSVRRRVARRKPRMEAFEEVPKPVVHDESTMANRPAPGLPIKSAALIEELGEEPPDELNQTQAGVKLSDLQKAHREEQRERDKRRRATDKKD
jgi:PAS domain S-box-containing protein